MVLLVSYPRFDVLALVLLPYMVVLAWFYYCHIPGSTFLLLSCCLIWSFSMVLLVSYPRFDVLAHVLLPYMVALAWFY